MYQLFFYKNSTDEHTKLSGQKVFRQSNKIVVGLLKDGPLVSRSDNCGAPGAAYYAPLRPLREQEFLPFG